MNLLYGIGNEQQTDDGVGPYLVKRIDMSGWKGVNCGIHPENYTSTARSMKPELIVIVDATEMGLSPGSLRVVPRERVDELAMNTHYMPLSILMRYLSESAKRVVFIGVQPKDKGDGDELTIDVREGAERLLELLKQNRLDRVPRL